MKMDSKKSISILTIEKYLGKLVIVFSELEDTLSEGLSNVLDIDFSDAKVLFSPVSFQKKIQILNALIRKHAEHLYNRDYIFELLTIANSLEEIRNKFIHSDYNFYTKPGNKIILKREKLKYKNKQMAFKDCEEIDRLKLKDLKNAITKIKECSSNLYSEFGQMGCYINKY